jgi:hypothetical protein
MRRLLALSLISLTGCSDVSYVGDAGFQQFAMTAATPALAVGEESALYLVEQTIELPIREPRPAQFDALSTIPEGVTIPYARMPWVKRHDYEIQIDYTIINLDDAQRRVTVVLNGGNEFHEYMPGFIIDDEEVIVEFSGWENTLVLEPLGRASGTIREEEIDEIAADLATVVNGVTNANTIVHPNSQSAHDPRAIPFVPSVVPALVALRLGVRTEGPAGDDPMMPPPAPNLVVEWTLRVRDTKDRVVRPSRAWQLPARIAFEPSSLMPPMP